MLPQQRRSADESIVTALALEADYVAPPWQRLLARLGPDITLFILFASVLLIVGRLYGAHYVLRLSTMLLPGCVAPGIVLVRAWPRLRAIVADRPGARAELARIAVVAARDWTPLVLVALVFDNLENYTGLVRAHTIDAALYRFDVALFGVEPSVAIARFYQPLLTDWMAVCYGSFLIIPMILGVALCLRDRSADFRELANAVMLQMWIAFFLFICFPAGPPRYFAPLRDGAFRAPIPSLLGFNAALQAKWDTYSPLLVRASFPSLHCAYGLMTLIYSRRFSDAVFPRAPRLWFWLVVPFELTLFVSVVYLRHHWIPDIAAGLTVALVVSQLTPWLRRAWPTVSRRGSRAP